MSKEAFATGRHCFQCGQWLNNTYLLNRRSYRCANCGTAFRHLRGFNHEHHETPRAANPWPRLVVASLLSGGMVALGSNVSEIEIHPLPVAVAVILTLVIGAFGRRWSQDPKLLTGAVLLAAALGTLVGFLSLDQDTILEDHERLTFIVIAWIGLGVFFLTNWMRTFRFPPVNEKGIIRESSDEEHGESSLPN